MNIFTFFTKPFTDRIAAWKDRHEPARSENGWRIIDKSGVARCDYSSPEAQERLRYLIKSFATFDAKTQTFNKIENHISKK